MNITRFTFSLALILTLFTTKAQPDKLRAVFTEDPSTKITLVFNTNNLADTNPELYYSTNLAAVANNTSSIAYRDDVLSNQSYGMYNNFVKLNNLTPDSKYYFKIKDSTGETPIYYFETIPNHSNERLSFIGGSDSRNNRNARQTANIIVSRLKPHAVFFDGDFTDNGNAEQWQGWFDDWQSTISSDGHIAPIVVARGNHEDNNQELTNLFGTNSTCYYALSFGGNLFKAYTLNSENTIINYAGQTDWLEQELENDQDYFYRFAQYHKPMRPTVGLKADGASQYAYWSPLFYQYNVDLVLESDVHTASTTYPIIPCTGGFNCVDGFIEDDLNGTVYTGQGSWGAPLRPADDIRSWTFYGKKINQFKLIFVDKEKIELRTISYENSLSINEVNINDRFNLPDGLSVEAGTNKLTGQPQEVLTIPSKKNIIYPKVKIALPVDNAIYYNPVDVDVVIENLTSLKNVNAVVFYLDGVNMGSDTSEPFSFKLNAADFNTARTYEINAIAFDINGVPSPIANKRINIKSGTTHTVTTKLKGSLNDAEQLGNNKVDVANYDLDLGQNGIICGLRFTNANVPKGVNVTGTWIQFTADERDLGSTNLTFYVEDKPYSTHFLPYNYDISNRSKAPVSVNWSPVPNWDVVGDNGPNQKTPNLSTLIQHLVDKPGWAIESPVTFIVEGSGHRVSETYDSDTLLSPVLTVQYTTNNREICAHCINYPDTIKNIEIGDNIDIIGAGYSNLDKITKIEFVQKLTGVVLKTVNNNPATLNYAIAGQEAITIKVTDASGASATKDLFICPGNCSNEIVWPGDADNNKRVNAKDVLYVCLANGNKGYPRPNATNNWQGQNTISWPGKIGEINNAHQDPDGNGMISLNDVDVIDLNYGKYVNVLNPVDELNNDGIILKQVKLPEPASFSGKQKIEYDLILITNDIKKAHGIKGSIDLTDFLQSVGDFVEIIQDLTDVENLFNADIIFTKYHEDTKILDFAVSKTDKTNEQINGKTLLRLITIIDDLEGSRMKSAIINNSGLMDANGTFEKLKSTINRFENTSNDSDASWLGDPLFDIRLVTKQENCSSLGSAEIYVPTYSGESSTEIKWSNNSNQNKISDLTAGMYWVKIYHNNTLKNKIDFCIEKEVAIEEELLVNYPVVKDGVYNASGIISLNSGTEILKSQTVEFAIESCD